MKNLYKIALTAFVAVLALASCQKGGDDKTVAVESVKLDKTSLTFTLGENKTEQLTATVLPENATNKKVVWESKDEAVATVDQTGKVAPGTTAGNTQIVVTTEDGGFTAKCAVEVKSGNVPVEDVVLSAHELTVGVSQSETLTYTIVPEDATQQFVIWSSDDEAIATVENGVVTGKALGTCTITAASAENPAIFDECEVTVTATVIPLDESMFSTNAMMTYVAIAQDKSTEVGVTDPHGFGGSPDMFFNISEEQAAQREADFATWTNMWDNDPDTCFHTNCDWGVPGVTWGNREEVNFGQHYIQVVFENPVSNLALEITANNHSYEGDSPVHSFGGNKTLALYYLLDVEEADWQANNEDGYFCDFGETINVEVNAENIKALRFQSTNGDGWTHTESSIGIAELKITAQ